MKPSKYKIVLNIWINTIFKRKTILSNIKSQSCFILIYWNLILECVKQGAHNCMQYKVSHFYEWQTLLPRHTGILTVWYSLELNILHKKHEVHKTRFYKEVRNSRKYFLLTFYVSLVAAFMQHCKVSQSNNVNQI